MVLYMYTRSAHIPNGQHPCVQIPYACCMHLQVAGVPEQNGGSGHRLETYLSNLIGRSAYHMSAYHMLQCGL